MRARTIAITVALALVAAVALFWISRGDDAPPAGIARSPASSSSVAPDPAEAPIGDVSTPGAMVGRAPAPAIGTGRIVGVLLDVRTQGPAADATIALAAAMAPGSSVVSGRPFATGVFLLDAVPAGAHMLRVETPGAPAVERAVNVHGGGVTNVGTIWCGATGALTGRVLRSDGEPASGAVVTLVAAREARATSVADFLDGILGRTHPTLGEAFTNADGAFAVSVPAVGLVDVVVKAVDHASAEEAVFLSPGVATPIVIRLDPASRISGVVRDVAGAPIAGARVAALRSADGRLYERGAAATDEAGRFDLTAAPGYGRYSVLAASAEGFAPAFAVVHAESTDAVIVLSPLVSATVIVRTADGERVTDGARVEVTTRVATGYDQWSPATAVTDARGEASLRVAAGDIHVLSVRHRELGSGTWSAIVEALRLDRHEVVAGGTISVTMLTRHQLQGRVLDGNGEALAGVLVRARAGGGTMDATAVSDVDGRYRLPLPHASERNDLGDAADERGLAVRVEATAPGLAMRDGYWTLRTQDGLGSSIDRDVVMVRAVRVQGRVTDEVGSPLAGVVVEEGDTGDVHAEARGPTSTTRFDGHFVLDGVQPDRSFVVRARRRHHGEGVSVALRGAAGATIDAGTIRLRGSTSLRIFVLDPDGRPLSGVQVDVGSDDASSKLWSEEIEVVTDATGWAHAHDVPIEPLVLSAFSDEFATEHLRLPPSSEDRAVTIRLRPRTPLRGIVLGEGGVPVVGADVGVFPVEGDISEWVPAGTDEAGRFEVTDAPDGQLDVSVHAVGYESATVRVTARDDDVVIRLRKPR